MDEPSSPQESEASQISNQLKNHPRRRPASESVSLKRIARRSKSPFLPSLPVNLVSPNRPNGSSSSSMDVDAASDVSEIAEQPSKCHKQSSGESTNPEKWFEESNNHIKPRNPTFADNEPPFFLQQSSDETTPPEIRAPVAQEHAQAATSLQLFIRGDAASSEGFRSVIDDLTIENRRLKRQLKRYGRLRNSFAHPEALFEVRVRGLPPEKKQELEELLHNFVSKIDATPRSSTNISSGRDGVPSSLQPGLTSPSTSRRGDSGYASWSASGQNSGSLSGQASAAQKAHAPSVQQNRRKDIQSYLSDIPAGLLPHQMGPMSDADKKKIIVRRLEQLFAGRDPSGAHQQPLQQEKVAQSAARADRKATLAPGDRFQEGVREARIMRRNNTSSHKPSASRLADHSRTEAAAAIAAASDSASELNQEEKASGSSGLREEPLPMEQRPTRPLDLDPYRAQIPSENMQYMRHLGFSPPDSDTMSAQEDGHGWIYLNVLYNMAQLHLANVPMEIVRKAINEDSKMLELSSDGRKLRWKGGRGVSRISSENSPAGGSQSRRTADGNKSSNQTSEASGRSRIQNFPNKLAYSPLFRREDSGSPDTGIDDDQYQISNVPATSPNPASSGIAGGQSRADDAPIIFYQNTAFYTDLSGDLRNVHGRKQSAYHTISLDPLGTKNDSKIDELRKLEFEKGPLSRPTALPNGSSTPSDTPSSGSLRVVPGSTDSTGSSINPDPMDFEASGIGGVLPADNFSINVRSRQNLKNQQAGSETTRGGARRKGYPIQIRRALQKQQLLRASGSPSSMQKQSKAIIQREIIGSKTHELPASQLPQGAFFHDSSDDDDDDEDILEYDSDEGSSSSSDIPVTAPQRMDWATVADSALSEAQGDRMDEESNGDSDESIDLLASARAHDPEMIRLKERECDTHVNDILAAEIPAGSSAATIEGGSGFNSPARYILDQKADGVTNPMSAASRRRMPTLKRARKSDDSEIKMGLRGPKSPKLDAADGPSK